MAQNKPLISLSIADLPINISFSLLFKYAKECGFDGVEILPGIKSYPHTYRIYQLSNSLSLPVLSIHHQFSVGKVFITSDQCFSLAKQLDARIVVHPLKKYGFSSFQQQAHLEEIKILAKKHTTFVSIENMGNESSLPVYKFFSKAHRDTQNLKKVFTVAKKYGFGVTFDTSHAELVSPHKSADFHRLYPFIENIHLSDYTESEKHLGLGEGLLDTRGFLQYLKKNRYSNLITLELSPRLYMSEKKYLTEIKESISLIKQIMY